MTILSPYYSAFNMPLLVLHVLYLYIICVYVYNVYCLCIDFRYLLQSPKCTTVYIRGVIDKFAELLYYLNLK